ncbi:MAG TPA: hypothetical protein VIN63_04585, partial [Candidatus Limnocylindria bacterium]
MGPSFEELLFLDDRLRLRRAGRLRRTSRLLRGARGSLGDTRGVRDAERFGGGGASRLLRRETRVLRASRLHGTALVLRLAFRRAALLVFLTDRREPFVFVTALVVATLFFFAPLS